MKCRSVYGLWGRMATKKVSGHIASFLNYKLTNLDLT